MKPWLSHLLLGLLLTFLVGAPTQFAIALLFHINVGWWAGFYFTLGAYLSRERRQSEEWYGSNRISPFLWRPRALRGAGYPALASLALCILVELISR